MKKYSQQLFIIVLFNLISVSSIAQCGLYEVFLDQKVNQSNYIIEGEVIDQRCYKGNFKNKIYTLHTIKVYSVLKGNVPHQINIITSGGKIDNQMEIASSLLNLKKGQVGLFFLNKETQHPIDAPQEIYSVFASWQGFYAYDLREELISEVFQNYSNKDFQFYDLLKNEYGIEIKEKYIPLAWGKKTQNNRLTVINNFSPLNVNAGIGDKITINGFGFGSTRGDSKVLFKNADNGGSNEVVAEPSQYISWSDSKIIVAVPQKAGTGKIAVEVGANRALSGASLLINFSIINTGAEDLVHVSRLVARSANKGYVWNMNVNFDADSIVKSNFLASFKKWRCTTFVNWTIGSNTKINLSERDTLSIISFDENNELPAGVLGLCTSYYSGCSGDDWYVEEQDLLFRVSNRWHFGDDLIASNKIDFQSVALHELGHAHQLAHVINTNDLMNFSISNGEIKRSVDDYNLEAAQWVINKSLESDICDKKRMQLLDAELCSDENFGFYNTSIYPNPFNDFLSIDFYLTKNNKLKLELFDLTGKLVFWYENENAIKGYLPLVISVPNHLISAGLYILKIEIGDEKVVKKLIKQ
jgi:hypothetical protein